MDILSDHPNITGPGQLSPNALIAPAYRAAIAAANAQLDKLPQLREHGQITNAAHFIADSHLTLMVQLLAAQLTSMGEPQLAQTV